MNMDLSGIKESLMAEIPDSAKENLLRALVSMC